MSFGDAERPSSTTRVAVAALAAGRVAFGAALLTRPRQIGDRWLGEVAAEPAAQVAIRGLGARDLVLSAGMVVAARGGSARPWLLATVASDLTDIAATIAARRSLPPKAIAGTVALAGGAAAVAVVLVARGA